MKKTVEVPVPEKVIKATTRKVEHTYCDVDGQRIPKGGIYTQCALCNRDMCQQHMNRDPRDWGDYPDRYCDICYHLKYEGQHQEEYEKLEADYDKALEALEDKIKKESLAWQPNQKQQ